MERTKVKSSNIVSIGWENEVLEVEFSSGTIYSYFSVPERRFKDLMASESKGKFFASQIKPHFMAAVKPQPARSRWGESGMKVNPPRAN